MEESSQASAETKFTNCLSRESGVGAKETCVVLPGSIKKSTSHFPAKAEISGGPCKKIPSTSTFFQIILEELLRDLNGSAQ